MKRPFDLVILLLLVIAGGTWGVMVAIWIGKLVKWIIGA